MFCEIGVDVTAWKSLKLIKPIMNALKYNKFTEPTPIQRETLPLALGGRNVIGAAETVIISLLLLILVFYYNY